MESLILIGSESIYFRMLYTKAKIMSSWIAKCGFIDFNESQPLMTLRFVFGNWSGIHLRAVDDNDRWGKNGRSLTGNAMFDWRLAMQCNVWLERDWQCCRNPRLALSSLHLSLLIAICHHAESGCCPARGERIYLICSTTTFTGSDVNPISTFVDED